MDRTERFYKIDHLIRSSRVVSRAKFLDEMEISPATFKRDLEYLRDRMNAPIIFDRELRGYRYDEGSKFELPGLWMNQSEVHALLTIQHLLTHIQPGLMDEYIQPIVDRVSEIFDLGATNSNELTKRIRILSIANRPINHNYFEMISSAVIERRKLQIKHYSRGKDAETDRIVSPQRLVHYKDNWYLDAWCHLRDNLRTFSVESIKDAILLNEKAKNISEKILDKELGSGYGIFSGSKAKNVTLKFNPVAARWVSTEIWHPEQSGVFDNDGNYRLSFPYSDERELLQDILKHGENVEVISPAALKKAVKKTLENTLNHYS